MKKKEQTIVLNLQKIKSKNDITELYFDAEIFKCTNHTTKLKVYIITRENPELLR